MSVATASSQLDYSSRRIEPQPSSAGLQPSASGPRWRRLRIPLPECRTLAQPIGPAPLAVSDDEREGLVTRMAVAAAEEVQQRPELYAPVMDPLAGLAHEGVMPTSDPGAGRQQPDCRVHSAHRAYGVSPRRPAPEPPVASRLPLLLRGVRQTGRGRRARP